jgi:hypothetical protein
MRIDTAGFRRPASALRRRPWLASVLTALLVLVTARSGTAQNDTHDLMEGRGRDVSFPVSCGADVQPRFDAALAALHSFWYGQVSLPKTRVEHIDDVARQGSDGRQCLRTARSGVYRARPS